MRVFSFFFSYKIFFITKILIFIETYCFTIRIILWLNRNVIIMSFFPRDPRDGESKVLRRRYSFVRVVQRVLRISMQKLRRNEVKRVTLLQPEDSRHDNYYARAYKRHTRRTRKLMRIVQPCEIDKRTAVFHVAI